MVEIMNFEETKKVNQVLVHSVKDTLLVAQQGRCAICKREVEMRKSTLDHHHLSGAIRGVLCNSCNQIVGLIETNKLNSTRVHLNQKVWEQKVTAAQQYIEENRFLVVSLKVVKGISLSNREKEEVILSTPEFIPWRRDG